LKSGAQAFDVLCYDDVPLSGFGGVADETLDQNALPWAQVGLDFTTDGSELFIADPEKDQLFILNTTTNELVMDGSVPKTIPVGVDPFDVEILNAPIIDPFSDPNNPTFNFEDRAYVANNGDDTISIVNVDPSVRAKTGPARILFEDFNNLTDLRIETMAGSEATKILFLVSPNRQRVLRYRLSGVNIDGDNPDPLLPFVVGPSPRRVALKK
jgi:hypothetical protein